MHYQDKIYGGVKIDEPIILELMKCKSMQRLKGIDQHGHYENFFPHSNISRFEHSVGVFILLREFGASILEQVSGLLHDVSHTVFSHVADYIFHDGSGRYQNFQDDELEGFIERSEIPGILRKHGINYEDILDDSKFLLKERELPDLCADRIDYFLRDALAFKKATKKEIKELFSNLFVEKKEWVFVNKDSAKKYANLFLEVNNACWSGLESGVMLKSMGELLKYCINKKIVTRDDLFTTDKEVWIKIRPGVKKDPRLRILVDRADNKYKYKISDKKDFDLLSLNKSRAVDPLFYENGKLIRLSTVDKEFKKLQEKYSKHKKYYIKFLEERSAESPKGLK